MRAAGAFFFRVGRYGRAGLTWTTMKSCFAMISVKFCVNSASKRYRTKITQTSQSYIAVQAHDLGVGVEWLRSFVIGRVRVIFFLLTNGTTTAGGTSPVIVFVVRAVTLILPNARLELLQVDFRRWFVLLRRQVPFIRVPIFYSSQPRRPREHIFGLACQNRLRRHSG